jgi:hypothetical protein
MLGRCGAVAAARAHARPGGVRRALPALGALGLALGVVACGHSSDTAGPDTVPTAERAAHLQEQKDRLDPPRSLATMRISEIIALPTFPRAYSRSDLAQISELEGRGVTVTGFVARTIRKDDGDYHVQVTEAPLGRCLDNDTTDQLITEVTPGIREQHPGYTFEALRALCGTPTEVRLSGWLLYDSPHKGDGGRSTPWEVHPVTRVEVCCWRELG